MVEELTAYTPADLQALESLMHELSESSSCDARRLDALLGDGNSHLYVLREESCGGGAEGCSEGGVGGCTEGGAGGGIVGCACLCVAHSPEFTLGFVEAVTVLATHRGRGYGRQLMEHLLAEARRLGVDRIHLTSRPSRLAANALYRRLGFTRHDTNCYVLSLSCES